MSDEDLNVEAAYNLETPEDNKRLYRNWAASYDKSFAEATGYMFPQHIARTFLRRGGAGPVLDVGAGTGLVAEEVSRLDDVVIDAFDLSAEMLDVAKGKNVYRNLIEGDLTQVLPLSSDSYAAVVSSGTFTHGHVGPDALDELMRIAAPDALFVLSIKTELFEDFGFKSKFESFGTRIRDFELEELPVYADDRDPKHANDTGLVASYRCG